MLSTIRFGMFRAALLVSLLIILTTNVAPAFASEPLFQASPMAGMDLSVDPGVDLYRFAKRELVDPGDHPGGLSILGHDVHA